MAFLFGGYMNIFFEIVRDLWLIGLTYAIFSIWEKVEPTKPDHQEYKIDEAWNPVDLDDEREFELDQQEKRKELFKV